MTEVVRIISPVDGSVYAERPVATDTAVDSALSLARSAQRSWKATGLEHRAELCLAAVEAMLAMTDDISVELAWQMGRPVRYGGGEMRGFAERARHMVSLAAEALARVDVEPKAGFLRYITRDPLGVVLVVAPWNYPFLTAVNTIVPALMAGNTVVLKHASQTLLVGERFARAFGVAGLPDGVFQNLVLSHAQTAALLAGGAVDRVNFTGSVRGGRDIERAAAGTFSEVGLELGGKDPAYVRADADLGHAVENIVDGAFFNSGQSCCGIERIYADRRVFDDFVAQAAALTAGYVLGRPTEQATTMGPMVKGSAADFVRSQISAAVSSGARQVVDLSGFDADVAGSPYLAPQILVGVDHSMSVMSEESFGPVVGIMAVDSDDEAIALMNDSPYGLTASIWTSDIQAARRIGEQVETGTVFMNRADYLDPALAWTGVKDTGRGITLSRLGYEHLTRAKSFHLRHDLG